MARHPPSDTAQTMDAGALRPARSAWLPPNPGSRKYRPAKEASRARSLRVAVPAKWQPADTGVPAEVILTGLPTFVALIQKHHRTVVNCCLLTPRLSTEVHGLYLSRVRIVVSGLNKLSRVLKKA
jgi:hypothetical protein